MKKIILMIIICFLVSSCCLVAGEEQTQLPTSNEIGFFVNQLISSYNNYSIYLQTYIQIDPHIFLLYHETDESFEVTCVKKNLSNNDTICFIFKKIAATTPVINSNFSKELNDFTPVIMNGKMVKKYIYNGNESGPHVYLFIISDYSKDISNNPKGRALFWAKYLFDNHRIISEWEPFFDKNKDTISGDAILLEMQNKINDNIYNNLSYTYSVFSKQDLKEFDLAIQNKLTQEKNILNQEKDNKRWINSFLFFVFNLIILLILLGILYFEEKKCKKELKSQYWIIVIGAFLVVLWAIFLSDSTSDYYQKGLPFVAIFIAFIIDFIFMRKKRNKIKDEKDLSYFG
ncbi:MAG: hypothetical protein MUO82_11805 [Candidatus Thermoplasmatota archaeon]|nr:hypothetical protein [Candidatus Thermoplasmatota archaeon]